MVVRSRVVNRWMRSDLLRVWSCFMGQIWRLHLLLLPAMASITGSSVVSVPSSFVGLRSSPADVNSNSNIVRSYATPFVPRRFPHLCVKASSSSLTESLGKAVAVVSAGVLVAGAAAGLGIGVASASAFDVLMGSNSGELIFIPSEFEVSAGETINFINNAGYPHNVVFDDDDGGVPAGVDPGSISMSKLLNGQNEKYSVVLKTPGKYAFYCEPHQGNGMEGKVTVK